MIFEESRMRENRTSGLMSGRVETSVMAEPETPESRKFRQQLITLPKAQRTTSRLYSFRKAYPQIFISGEALFSFIFGLFLSPQYRERI